MNCPFCGQQAQRYLISYRQQAKAKQPRPLIRGTNRAQERARKAALARWKQARATEKGATL
jgi:hypothetical protein